MPLSPTSIQLPPHLQKLLQAEARRLGVPMASVIRWAVADRYNVQVNIDTSGKEASRPGRKIAEKPPVAA